MSLNLAKIKSAVLSLFILAIAQQTKAQEPVIVNVTYELTYVRDLADKTNPYKANMILSLGKETSRYCSEKCFNENDPQMRREKAKMQQRQTASSATTVVSGNPLLIVNKYGTLINEEILKNWKTKQVHMIGVLGFKSYKIEAEWPVIKWDILPDKKIIGRYNCQKAIGSFAGRTYEVWFSTDLPFNNGPWKLGGLPGLILEATDQLGEVKFSFKNITRSTSQEETTGSFLASNFMIKVDQKSYDRLKKEFDTAPEAVMSALAPNAKLAVKNIDNPQSPNVKKIKRYNPMEIK
jgi:GLPGLI family protein